MVHKFKKLPAPDLYRSFLRSVRKSLLQIARADPHIYTTILVNGSGTCAAEGTLRTTLGNSKKKVSNYSLSTVLLPFGLLTNPEPINSINVPALAKFTACNLGITNF